MATTTTQHSERANSAVEPRFPFLDLHAQEGPLREELLRAIADVVDSRQYILGPAVDRFERDVANYIGCEHAIGCASGTDALLLALRALDVRPGDEVIVPSFTFVATAGAAAWLGAKPVFAEIDADTFNITADTVAGLITPRTKAIIPVHLFGLMADMDALLALARECGVAVIEDAAQAIGAKYKGRSAGTLGQIGCFSFYPSKNVGAAGEGGLVTTNDSDIAARLKLLRNHGSPRRYEYEMIGTNSRLDSIQAAVLDVKLKHLDRWTEGRRRNAARYEELFAHAGIGSNVRRPGESPERFHIFNQYTIRIQQRDALRQHLAQHGIPTEIYYPHPLHLQPAFAYLGYKPGLLPVTEATAREVLSLPIYPELGDENLRAAVSAIVDFY